MSEPPCLLLLQLHLLGEMVQTPEMRAKVPSLPSEITSLEKIDPKPVSSTLFLLLSILSKYKTASDSERGPGLLFTQPWEPPRVKDTSLGS